VFRIGLTGGIASGKSTVAKQFADLGADIVDTDEIARELVGPGSPALAAIVERFGASFLAADGSLDRGKLRREVFADPAKRRDLEAILHPRIRQAALARAESSAAPYIVFVVPLLFETGFDRLVDRTVVVDCPAALQLERLVARDGQRPDEAQAIIDAQLAREARLARADDVIDNAADLSATRVRVAELHGAYLSMSQNCSSPSRRAE
jgi:dephospho-CoA kinase